MVMFDALENYVQETAVKIVFYLIIIYNIKIQKNL